MAEPDPTPTDDELLAFDRGLLPDDASDVVVRWLEAHPEGEDRIRQLTERCPDQAVEALRGPCRIDAEMEHLSAVASRLIDGVLDRTGLRDRAPEVPVPEQIRDYRLLGPLGRGGMGSVYRARHTRLHRDVALKLLPGRLAADREFRARFVREMAVVGQLNHPNLVVAYDAGLEGDYLFLVMELLDGKDLSALVAEGGPLSVADACEVARQAALGLHHAHEHGTVHRDVKPSNLFLTRAGLVKVIDLGLALPDDKQLAGEPVSSAQTVIGTAEYMAPEQWARTRVDRRADVYGLGCTLYCLLIGRPPFVATEGDSWIALLEAHRNEQPPALPERRLDVPAGLADLVAWMLAKLPDQRPASAAEVAEALAAFTAGHDLAGLAGGRTQAARTGPPADASPLPSPSPGGAAEREAPDTLLQRQGGKPTGRRRRARWPLVVGLVVAVLALGVAVRFWNRLSPKPDSPAAVASRPSPAERPEPDPIPVVLKPAHPLSKHTDRVMAVAYSPDGKLLASAGADHLIWLWDTQTWEARGPLRGHPGEVAGLAFAPDGSTLASVTCQGDECEIRLWDVATGRPAGLGEANPGNWGVAYSPDGRTLVCAGWSRTVHVFDVASGLERFQIPEATTRFVRALSISPDGRLIATGGAGQTHLWDLATGKELPAQLPVRLYPLFLPSGEGLAGWTFDAGRITLCDLAGQNVRTWRAHPGNIEGLAVSPDGRFLASLGGDGGKLWRVADRKKVADLVGHRGTVYAASFAPDGKHLATAGYDDATVCIWDLPEMCHVRRE